MRRREKAAVVQFDQDVIDTGGYLYANKPSLSSLLANKRLTGATLEILSFKNKTAKPKIAKMRINNNPS